jgi:hypothetical protein
MTTPYFTEWCLRCACREVSALVWQGYSTSRAKKSLSKDLSCPPYGGRHPLGTLRVVLGCVDVCTAGDPTGTGDGGESVYGHPFKVPRDMCSVTHTHTHTLSLSLSAQEYVFDARPSASLNPLFRTSSTPDSSSAEGGLSEWQTRATGFVASFSFSALLPRFRCFVASFECKYKRHAL